MPYRPPPIGRKQLVITRPAREDIDAILDYLAREAGIETALRFADTIDGQLAKLAFLGHAGVSREHLSPGLRVTLIGSYVVYFVSLRRAPPCRADLPRGVFGRT